MNDDKDFDERLRTALRAEDAELLARIDSELGMADLVRSGFRGPTAWWVWLVGAVQLVLFALAVWSCVGFVRAAQVDDRVWWGEWLLLTMMVVGMSKLMVWNHIERNVLRREIKRVELMLATLAAGQLKTGD